MHTIDINSFVNMLDTKVGAHDCCIKVEIGRWTKGTMHMGYWVSGAFCIITPHWFIEVLRALDSHTGVCLQIITICQLPCVCEEYIKPRMIY